jgi:acyl carrier protein
MTKQQKIDFIQNAIFHLFKKKITLSPSDVLLNIGLDSLDIVELQIYYEEQTGHELNDEAQIHTVAELIALMK